MRLRGGARRALCTAPSAFTVYPSGRRGRLWNPPSISYHAVPDLSILDHRFQLLLLMAVLLGCDHTCLYAPLVMPLLEGSCLSAAASAAVLSRSRQGSLMLFIRTSSFAWCHAAHSCPRHISSSDAPMLLLSLRSRGLMTCAALSLRRHPWPLQLCNIRILGLVRSASRWALHSCCAHIRPAVCSPKTSWRAASSTPVPSTPSRGALVSHHFTV
mmetsp:Transcript_2284/g.5854  ORF Transcript_2284/g.5854 Transcript_2284/m.5854 type:complete len:214 (-) Transcript_2284:1539-2180(-)